MVHENCGGELRRLQKQDYQCSKCRVVVVVGPRVPAQGHPYGCGINLVDTFTVPSRR